MVVDADFVVLIADDVLFVAADDVCLFKLLIIVVVVADCTFCCVFEVVEYVMKVAVFLTQPLIPNCYSWNRSKSAVEEKNKKPITQSINEESTTPNNNKKKIKLGGDSSSCQKSEEWISKQSMLSSSIASVKKKGLR